MEYYWNPDKNIVITGPENWYRVKKYSYTQLTKAQFEFYKNHKNATLEEILRMEMNPEPVPERTLEIAIREKLEEIDIYDTSTMVNGFYYDGELMWLDKMTRAALKNTIESLETIGRNELNIWYEDKCITLPLTAAKVMLAALEVYATDCYNVTAQHKLNVKELTTIEDADEYDYTIDYPEQLNFNSEDL